MARRFHFDRYGGKWSPVEIHARLKTPGGQAAKFLIGKLPAGFAGQPQTIGLKVTIAGLAGWLKKVDFTLFTAYWTQFRAPPRRT